MARDLLKLVQTHAGIGHPGQSGVAKVVASQVFVAEFGDHFVPVRGTAKNTGSDSSTAGADEQAGIGVVFTAGGDAVEGQLPNYFYRWGVGCHNARLHSRLDYLTPAEYLTAYYAQNLPRRPALVYS